MAGARRSQEGLYTCCLLAWSFPLAFHYLEIRLKFLLGRDLHDLTPPPSASLTHLSTLIFFLLDASDLMFQQLLDPPRFGNFHLIWGK